MDETCVEMFFEESVSSLTYAVVTFSFLSCQDSLNFQCELFGAFYSACC